MAPNTEALQLRSYSIWENEGRPHGRDMDHWLQAEAELATEAAKAPKPKKTKSTKPGKVKASTKRAAKLN